MLVCLQPEMPQCVVGPVFVGGLGTPYDYLDNAIAPFIVATRNRNTHAAYQYFQRLARLFNGKPESIASICRQRVVYICKGAAAFDHCYIVVITLFRMRNRRFHNAQYFH